MQDFFKNGSRLLFRKQTNILSAAFVIMATYGISHLVGLMKTRLLISHFFDRAASDLDVYYAAFVVPDTVFQLLVIGSLSAAFIPAFIRHLAKNEKDAWYMASATVNLVITMLVIVCILLFAFARPISMLIAPGFTPDQVATMVVLMRIMLVAQIFFAISGFLTSIIQTHHRFLIPALAPVVYNLGIIAGIMFLSPALGIVGPAIGVVVGAVLHMVIQLPLAYRLGFRFSGNLDVRHSGVREVVKLMPPRAVALGTDQIEQFVAVTLASLLAPGSLSLLNAARLLYSIPTSLFGITISQAAFPALSKAAALEDLTEYRRILAESFLQIIFVALPVSTLFIVLRIPIVRIIFGASSFPWAATILTGQTLAILALSAGFYAVMQLVIRGFYALHDTTTPLKIGLGAALFNIVFSVVAINVFGWGVLGIAAAISATAIIETLVLLIILYRKLSDFTQLRYALWQLTKMILISFITGLALWLLMHFFDKFVFDTTRTLPLLALTAATSLLGVVIYAALAFVLKIPELSVFVNLLRKVGGWKKMFTTPPEPLIVPAPDQN